MRWDLFSPRSRPRKSRIFEEIEGQIRAIEKFAPREHKKERASRYYHYRILEGYLVPLSDLLLFLSRNRPESGMESRFLLELFWKLKGFYDPRGRLSAEETIRDGNFIRKLSEALVFFYGKPRLSSGEVKRRLAALEEPEP